MRGSQAPLSNDAPQASWPAERVDVLYRLNHAAMRYWHRLLMRNEEVLTYLEERGWPEPRKLAARYGLGYAPGIGDQEPTLVRAVLRKGFQGTAGRRDLEAALVAAGLAKIRDGRIRDHFFGRLMFPVADRGQLAELGGERARIAGFGGRYVPRASAPPPGEGREPPKYLNTPEGVTYPKRQLLYGLSWAARAIEERGEAVVLEGYMDALRVWESGFAHAIAQCGTALTTDHLGSLLRAAGAERADAEASRGVQMKKWGRLLEIVLATDEDEAGRRAADRGSRAVARAGYRVRIASFEGGKDPDDLLKGAGAEGTALFQEVLDRAATPAVAYLDRQGPAAEAPWNRSLRGLVATLRNLQQRPAGGGEEDRRMDALRISERLGREGNLHLSMETLQDLVRRAGSEQGSGRDWEVGR